MYASDEKICNVSYKIFNKKRKLRENVLEKQAERMSQGQKW